MGSFSYIYMYIKFSRNTFINPLLPSDSDSYLLRDPNMRVRTAYQPYLDRVKVYFDNLLPLVSDLQFSQGGPIIALQVTSLIHIIFCKWCGVHSYQTVICNALQWIYDANNSPRILSRLHLFIFICSKYVYVSCLPG